MSELQMRTPITIYTNGRDTLAIRTYSDSQRLAQKNCLVRRLPQEPHNECVDACIAVARLYGEDPAQFEAAMSGHCCDNRDQLKQKYAAVCKERDELVKKLRQIRDFIHQEMDR